MGRGADDMRQDSMMGGVPEDDTFRTEEDDAFPTNPDEELAEEEDAALDQRRSPRM